MNKVYNHNWLVDKDILTDALKYYQSTVLIPEFISEEGIINKEVQNKIWGSDDWGKLISNYEYPEAIIGRYSFYKLDTWAFNVIEEFNKILDSEKILMYQPIFTFTNFIELPNGHYVIDFDKKELLLYKHCESDRYCRRKNNDDSELCISYFIDIFKSIFLNGSLGLTEAIFQIGSNIALHKKNTIGNGVESLFSNAPQQLFTRSLGLNAREQLFVKNHIFYVSC